MLRATRRLPLALAASLASPLAACRPAPPEAPTDLGELSTFFFDELAAEDPAVLEVGAGNLLDLFINFETDGGSLSPDVDREDRTWTLPILEREQMGDLPIPEEVDPARQLPVGVAFRSAHPPAAHAELIALVDQTPIEPESAETYTREFETDVACFVDESCGTLLVRDTIYRHNMLLDLTYWQYKFYRRLALPEDAGQAVVARSWLEEQFVEPEGTDPDTIEQWSALSVLIEEGTGSLRFSTLWGSSSLNDTFADTPEFLTNQVADGMEEGFVDTDAYLDGE
jgi:hypothetical protein